MDDFEKKYVGEVHINQLRDQFTLLVQGNFTVFEDEQKFPQLSRYANELIATE